MTSYKKIAYQKYLPSIFSWLPAKFATLLYFGFIAKWSGSIAALWTRKQQKENILNKIINAPCGALKLLLALGVAKYIKSYKIHFVAQYATDYCPLEHDSGNLAAHLGSPISCYINNLHGAFIFLLSVHQNTPLRGTVSSRSTGHGIRVLGLD